MTTIRIRTTPERISALKENEIFVFGSNLAGVHGGGAAKTAREHFGAIYGQGIGRQGQCYAIPTKNEFICTLRADRIGKYIDDFLFYARGNPQLTFLLTPIGCGLAGLKPEVIAPFFRDAPENCVLPLIFQMELGLPFLQYHSGTFFGDIGQVDDQNHTRTIHTVPAPPVEPYELPVEKLIKPITFLGVDWAAGPDQSVEVSAPPAP